MIGDRYTDIDGAHACNLTPLAAAGATLRPVRWKNTVPTKSSKPEQIEEAVNRYFQTH